MRYYEIICESTRDLTFRREHQGSHHGQHDYRLLALLDGQVVADLEYVVYEAKPSIQMINVERKRNGIATAMLRHLQNMFPDTEIDWGFTTDEGTALYNSLTFRDVPNPVYAKLQAALERTRTKLENYAQQAEAFYADQSEDARKALHAATADWNDLHNREAKIERVMHGMKPSKRLIV
jgi:hypothetical protein